MITNIKTTEANKTLLKEMKSYLEYLKNRWDENLKEFNQDDSICKEKKMRVYFTRHNVESRFTHIKHMIDMYILYFDCQDIHIEELHMKFKILTTDISIFYSEANSVRGILA